MMRVFGIRSEVSVLCQPADKIRRCCSSLLVVAVLGQLLTVNAAYAAGANSDYGSPRQYYSGWSPHSSGKYHYRRLYYKPNASYVGYKHHYVIHYPSRPKHNYFYNPYKKTYWGRCGINHGGMYSMLPPVYRKPTVEQVPESAFPQPGDPPLLPEVEDGLRLDLPPDDLPLP